jgi:large subunit ribosomal protein L21
VLVLSDGENITVGTPVVEGARVMAVSQGEAKGDKIVVFRYKKKVHYRNKTGHRQIFTKLSIDRILKPGETVTVAKKTRRKKAARDTAAEAPVENAAENAAENKPETQEET